MSSYRPVEALKNKIAAMLLKGMDEDRLKLLRFSATGWEIFWKQYEAARDEEIVVRARHQLTGFVQEYTA